MIAAGHTALVCPCLCVQVSVCVSHSCTNAPVLPQTVIWLSSKPATAEGDNSFVSCCRHVTTPHLILSQHAGRRGGRRGERNLLCQTLTPKPPHSYLSSVFSSLFFICQCLLFSRSFSHSVTLSLPCCVTGVLCKYHMLDSTSISSGTPPLEVIPTYMNTC